MSLQQFDIQGKVALVTGGCQGIGFEIAKELLRNKAKGVTIADINVEKGKRAVQQLNDEFGSDKSVFIKTDVTIKSELEDTFKQTVNNFKQLDIVINNAGIANDHEWQKEIAVNLKGVLMGSFMALEEYLPKNKIDKEAVIVNTSSILGLIPYPGYPIYTATKHALIGFGRSLGNEFHYNRTSVKVLTICPGLTRTELAENAKSYASEWNEFADIMNKQLPVQESNVVGKALMDIIKIGNNGSIWVIEDGESYEVKIPKIPEMRIK